MAVLIRLPLERLSSYSAFQITKVLLSRATRFLVSPTLRYQHRREKEGSLANVHTSRHYHHSRRRQLLDQLHSSWGGHYGLDGFL